MSEPLDLDDDGVDTLISAALYYYCLEVHCKFKVSHLNGSQMTGLMETVPLCGTFLHSTLSCQI